MLGSTGYGKSNFNALLSQRIRGKFKSSRIVIFDINGEYADAFIGQTRVKETILGSVPPPPAKLFSPLAVPPPPPRFLTVNTLFIIESLSSIWLCWVNQVTKTKR